MTNPRAKPFIRTEGLFGLMILRVSVYNPLALLPEPEASRYASPHYMLEKAAHPMEGRKPKRRKGPEFSIPSKVRPPVA